jgi:hypothetical protein
VKLKKKSIKKNKKNELRFNCKTHDMGYEIMIIDRKKIKKKTKKLN